MIPNLLLSLRLNANAVSEIIKHSIKITDDATQWNQRKQPNFSHLLIIHAILYFTIWQRSLLRVSVLLTHQAIGLHQKSHLCHMASVSPLTEPAVID